MTRFCCLFVFALFASFPSLTLATINEGQFLQIVQDLHLNQTPVSLTLINENIIATGEEIKRELEFTHPEFGQILISIKHPAIMHKPLPVVFILSGFGTGRKTLDLISNMGQNIIVSYEYPSPFDPQKIVLDLSELRKTPGQVLGIFQWLQMQTYVDRNRINFMGVSFGTLFLPIIQRIAQFQNLHVPTTIYAYGGVDLPVILEPQLRKYLDNFQTQIMLALVANSTWQLEPKNHLPTLCGDFLIVHAEEEQVFPPASRQMQIELTPNPKSVVVLPGTHIGPDRPDLIAPFIAATRNWLLQRRAIEP